MNAPRIIDQVQVVPGVIPINLASAAQTGDVVDMEGYGNLLILFLAGVGAAAQDVTITLEQGTDVAFGTNKALNFTSVFVKQASALTAVAQFTEVTQSAANTYTSATSGETQQLWAIEIKAEDLDIANNYKTVRASLGDTGSTSKIGTIMYILGNPRYAAQPMPGAIA